MVNNNQLCKKMPFFYNKCQRDSFGTVNYILYLWAKKKVNVSKMTRLTPELVTELFCPTLISCENPNVNGAVENFLEQNV
jgi:hypothetical protein